MTEITREIIIDLLPAYFAGEASDESRRLVEGYFERDPELARLARSMNEKLLQAAPVHLPEEVKMKTLHRTRTTLMWQAFVLAVLALIFLVVLAAGAAFVVLR